MQAEAQVWSGLVTEYFCFLCARNLQNLNQAVGHLTSRLHKDNQAWMKKHIFDYFRDNSTQTPSASSLYCFVCRQYFTSKELLQKHVAAFPHNVLAKAKSNLVKEGIREEFALSVEMGKYMDCIICNVDLTSQNNAQQHMNSSAHKRELSKWKTYLPVRKSGIPISESQWFYCKVCNTNLDGTTEAAKHNQKHSKTQHAANGHICNTGTQAVDNNNVSKVTVQKTASKVTPLSAAPTQINKSRDPKVTNNEKKSLLPKKCDDNNTDSKLKESVYEQLEKLIQTLYYSKKVPYDVSLQYLKKVNKEVEEIVKEQSKDDSQINSLAQSTKKTLAKNVEVDKSPPPKLGSQTVLPSSGSNNTEPKVINLLPIPEETQNNVPVKESISTLLSKVVKQKLEVKQQNKDVVEMEVLDEMEILLKEVNKEEAPLQEILKCLEKFNKELDEQFMNTVDTGGESVSDQTKENVTSDNNKTLDEDSNIKDTNELVSNKTPKLTYTNTELLSLRQSAKNICTDPDINYLLISLGLYNFTNNCTSDNTIYSYYTATDFNKFMGFLDVYLQTSADMCQKKSLMFQTNLGLPETTKTQLTAIEEKPVNNSDCEFSFNTFYDYYTGSDFEAFMDFRSQYLYCSIEPLDLPNKEANSICENQVPDEGYNNSLPDYYDCDEI